MLSLKGNIVISLACFSHSDKINLTEEQEKLLTKIHQKKIDMSDEIFVVNKNGYIGEHTQKDIEYAKSKKLKISFLE